MVTSPVLLVERFRHGREDLEPVLVASDGNDHPFAAFVVGGMHFAVWQLPEGVERSRDENDRNTYLVFTHPDPKRAHARS